MKKMLFELLPLWLAFKRKKSERRYGLGCQMEVIGEDGSILSSINWTVLHVDREETIRITNGADKLFNI